MSEAVPVTKRTSVFGLSFHQAAIRQILIVVATIALALGGSLSAASANPKYAGIVIDAKTGKTLYESDADALRYPASLTKMMTLYLTFEALDSGRISLNSKVPVSPNAAAEPPSKLGVGAGRSVTVEQAIMALVTRSANDIATALGEFIGGSESRFAQLMTAKARSLGMSRTTYRNAHGLPNTAQMTTARDQARLSMALRQHYPQYYGFFSTRSFKFGKQTIGNHNRLLGAVRGVDGIKTGYTRAAGYNLATSAQADGRSIVGVVLGATSGARRNQQMTKLVQAYLPQASRSGGFLMARGSSVVPADAGRTVTLEDDFVLPSRGPVPVARYEASNRIESAFASPAAAPAQAALQTMTAPSAQAMPPAPIPAQAPAYAPQEQSALEPSGVDTTTTASTQPSGWVVQIGTSPNRDTALALLRDAQNKGGQVLRSATPFTVAFANGSAQIFRARFGGFGDQKDAVNACNSLKRKGIQCWAAMQ